MNARIKGKSDSASIFKMTEVGCVYHIWHKIDMRIFEYKKKCRGDSKGCLSRGVLQRKFKHQTRTEAEILEVLLCT